MGLELRRLSRYDRTFYDFLNEGSLESAHVVVPLVIDLLGMPASVVDLGCGAGAWLKVFADHGVTDYTGMDGAYVERDQLLIPEDHFRPTDLNEGVSVDRRFTLAVCLEVAEHLMPESADRLVADLTALSEVILFSAAIPYQGGVRHVNEQWPTYWQDKFEAQGYVGLDPFRMKLWDDERVEYWFAQNLLLYVSQEVVKRSPALEAEFARSGGVVPSLVHPRTYASKARVAANLMRVIPQPVVALAKRYLTLRR